MSEDKSPQLKALRGKIVEVYGSIANFAREFGISDTQMQNKLSGRSGWSLPDIQKAAALLGIINNASECHRVFFCLEN